jgi:HTH-type transcriptional regulator/antitoxin HigA
MSAAVKLHPDYLSLVRRLPLRPIRGRRAHDQAMAMVRELAPADEGSLSLGEQDYLDALTVLIEDYDRRQEDDATAQASGLDVLKSLMEARAMTVGELGEVVGSQANASLILSGRRPMSKAVMVKLGEFFGVRPAVFF